MSTLIDNPCPSCKANLTGAVCTSEPVAMPKPGDLTVCIYCAITLRFDERGDLQVLTAAEKLVLEPEERRDLLRAELVVRQFQSLRR